MCGKNKKPGEKFKKITCYFSIQKKKQARKHDWCVINFFFTNYFYEKLDFAY